MTTMSNCVSKCLLNLLIYQYIVDHVISVCFKIMEYGLHRVIWKLFLAAVKTCQIIFITSWPCLDDICLSVLTSVCLSESVYPSVSRCARVFVYAGVCAFVFVYAPVCIYFRVRECIHVCAFYVCVHVHACVSAYLCVFVLVCPCVHLFKYVFSVCVCVCVFVSDCPCMCLGQLVSIIT